MLRRFIQSCGRRNFSRSSIRTNKDVVKSSEPQQPPQSNKYDTIYDCIPNEFDKKILVWSGRFKNKESIPDRVSLSTLNTAKSKVRIKISNLLMVFITLLTLGYVWHAKNLVKKGESLLEMAVRLDEEIIEKGRQKKLQQSKLESKQE